MTHSCTGYVYTHPCLSCAVRFIRHSRPSRQQQMRDIDYLVAYHGYTREQIMAALNG